MTNNQSLLLKSTEAADRLGISATTLHRMVKAGKLECVRFAANSIYFTNQQSQTESGTENGIR